MYKLLYVLVLRKQIERSQLLEEKHRIYSFKNLFFKLSFGKGIDEVIDRNLVFKINF